MITGTYHGDLVVLSVLIAIVASYAAFSLGERVSAYGGRRRWAWLTSGAIAMGFAIWSMHYVGMLAFVLPVPVLYHVPTVILSLVAAVPGAAVALYIVSKKTMHLGNTAVAGLCLGGAIVAMHYIGMAAMRSSAMHHYRLSLVILSVVVAITCSSVAAWLTFRFGRFHQGFTRNKIIGASLMGLGIASMHYTAMAAAYFVPGHTPPIRHTVEVSTLGAFGIGVTTLVLLGTVLVTLWWDRQLANERLLQRLYRDLRDVINTVPAHAWSALPDVDVDFVNQRWQQFTGLPAEDALGWNWEAVLHPDDRAKFVADWRAALNSGQPMETEARVRRADGEYRCLLVRNVSLRDERGNIVKWYGTGLDIEDRKQAEQALRKSEERWRSVFENSAIGVSLTDPESGRFLATNHVYQTMVGYTEEELRALSFLDVTPEEYREANWALATELLEGKRQQYQMEKKYVREDGSLIWVSVNVSLVPGTDRVPRFFMALSEDITERKRAEEALRRSQSYLAEAERLSHTGSWALLVPTGAVQIPELKMVHWSQEMYRIFCIDPGPTLPSHTDRAQRLHPEDLARHLAIVWQAILDRTDFDTEYRLLLPNGTTRYIHAVGHPVMNASGDVIELVGTAMDVTEQHEASAALQTAFEQIKAEQTELRRMTDAIATYIIVLSPDGTALYANQTVLDYTGLTLEDVRKDHRVRIFHPEDVERLGEQRAAALARGEPFELEQRALGKDGEYRWFLGRYNPVHDDQGNIIRWYATGTDIDDRKRAEERMRDENLALREQIDQAFMFEEIVGASPALQNVLSSILKVAPTDSTVLITGETGTGKELIARAIHKHSQRSGQAFISVNCASIPSSLIASELFGHEKGAFTGAVQRRQGRFELAHSGTIFLDEVGDLPAEAQVALLRVLQERQFERVGGNRILTTDVRVIAATNRDLTAAISAGTFRSDLFYRLNVFPIEVPPLRERREDIPLLVEYFIDRYARKAGKSIRGVNKKTLDLFQSYPWPGNIRELQNIIERSVIVCETENFSVDENWLTRQPTATEPNGHLDLSEKLALQEKEMIEAALRDCGGQVSGPSGAAARLDMPRSTLESKIRSLKINKNRFKAA